jgi:hypothetical protein
MLPVQVVPLISVAQIRQVQVPVPDGFGGDGVLFRLELFAVQMGYYPEFWQIRASGHARGFTYATIALAAPLLTLASSLCSRANNTSCTILLWKSFEPVMW